MNADRYSTTLVYVDHTCGAVRPYHSAIMEAVKVDGVMSDALADLIVLTKAPGLNADGTVRWLVDWA